MLICDDSTLTHDITTMFGEKSKGRTPDENTRSPKAPWRKARPAERPSIGPVTTVPSQPTPCLSTLPKQCPLLQSTWDVSKTVAGQPSEVYHASVGALDNLFDNGLDGYLYDCMSTKLDSLITSIDGDCFFGDEKDLGQTALLLRHASNSQASSTLR